MTLSFSAAAKAEICRNIPSKHCCALAECFGILLFCNSFTGENIRIITESREFALLLPKLFKRAFSMDFDIMPSEDAKGKLNFQITDLDKISDIMEWYGFDPQDTLSMHIITTKDSLLQKYAPYEGVLFLLSSDTAIFVQDYSDSIQIPKSLEYHFQTIKMIISARKQIESIEQTIENIAVNYMQEALRSKPENTLYSRIAQEIEGDMDNVTDLLIQIKERDLNSLSSQQQEYFKPGLTERYNNFLIFFE